MSRSKQIGTEAETAVVNWLKASGFPHADRLTLHGTKDIGDVRVADGLPVVIEVKAGKSAVTALGSHVKELGVEVANANAEVGVVIAKRARVGTANVGDWFAVMTADAWLALFKKAYDL